MGYDGTNQLDAEHTSGEPRWWSQNLIDELDQSSKISLISGYNSARRHTASGVYCMHNVTCICVVYIDVPKLCKLSMLRYKPPAALVWIYYVHRIMWMGLMMHSIVTAL